MNYANNCRFHSYAMIAMMIVMMICVYTGCFISLVQFYYQSTTCFTPNSHIFTEPRFVSFFICSGPNPSCKSWARFFSFFGRPLYAILFRECFLNATASSVLVFFHYPLPLPSLLLFLGPSYPHHLCRALVAISSYLPSAQSFFICFLLPLS